MPETKLSRAHPARLTPPAPAEKPRPGAEGPPPSGCDRRHPGHQLRRKRRCAGNAARQPDRWRAGAADRRASTQSGQVQLSGKIEYLQYAENQQSGGSLLARLFSVNGSVARAVGRAGDVLWCLGLGCLLRGCAGCCAAGTRGGAGAVLFRDIAVFAAAAVLVCGFAAGASAGGLARWYMSAAVLLGPSAGGGGTAAVHRAAAALAELACRPLRLVHKMLVRPAQMRL